MNKAWETFAKDYDLDPIEVAHATHGRHLYDTLKEYCQLDEEDKLQVCAAHSYAPSDPVVVFPISTTCYGYIIDGHKPLRTRGYRRRADFSARDSCSIVLRKYLVTSNTRPRYHILIG